jgi:prepilin-type N-terminal cleavage/methylation domain-containing protein/prepilin-type processing-associated H-X9-DG protein
MTQSRRVRRAFTLVELLVVIGIIAVLVGILLPVIGRARKQASTVACMASLRSMGQLIYLYAGDHKGSLPYGFYRSDAVTSSISAISDSDPNTALYIWWSVLRSYMRAHTNADNGAANGASGLSSRGMKGLTCPTALGTDRGVSYTLNMIAMPDREFELFQHTLSGGVNPWPIPPAHFSKLYSDNILAWDATEIPPTFGSQYVVGYEIDKGSFQNPRRAFQRYRDMAAIPGVIPPGDKLDNEVPIFPGTNQEATSSPEQRGNIRWRHGNNDRANFLFTDGTVRTLKITTGTPGLPNCRGEVLHKYFRIKSSAGFKLNG